MSKQRQATTGDEKVEQLEEKFIPELGERLSSDDHVDIVKPAGGYVSKSEQKYLDDLLFNEDPVTIVIHGSGDALGSRYTDLVAVNGVPAQVLTDGKWMSCPHLPKDTTIVTRRKYVERLIRAKGDTIQTKMGTSPDGREINSIVRTSANVNGLSIVKDDSPYASEWVARCQASTY